MPLLVTGGTLASLIRVRQVSHTLRSRAHLDAFQSLSHLARTLRYMTNPIRNDAPGTFHHWMNRGARRRPTFLSDADRSDFLELLGVARYRYGVETHGFSLMTNHHHVVVRSQSGELSAAIQYFASQYTRRFNHRHGFDGPQCRARFTSVPITTTEQLMTTTRYVHRNPYSLDPTLALTDHD